MRLTQEWLNRPRNVVCAFSLLLVWIPSFVIFKSRLFQLSKSPEGNPDHGLTVHIDASIQNINLTVLTTARHKKALKTSYPWFLRSDYFIFQL